MLAAYGVDVRDPRTSLRRVHVLLDRLPPDARRGGEHWSIESELLAVLIDSVAQLTWITMRANGAKNARKPKPIPRPPRHGDHPPAGRPEPPREHPGGERSGGPRKLGSWSELGPALTGVRGVRVHGNGTGDG
jgi:hypothetical protein